MSKKEKKYEYGFSPSLISTYQNHRQLATYKENYISDEKKKEHADAARKLENQNPGLAEAWEKMYKDTFGKDPASF